LSKRVVRRPIEADDVSGVIKPLSASQKEALDRSSASRLQVGLRAMAEEARRKGWDSGFEEGFRAGAEMGREHARQEFEDAHRDALREFRLALEAFLARAERAVDAWYERAEEQVAPLAIDIAQAAVCRELATSRDSVYEITREALRRVRQGTSVRVRANPLDAPILEKRRGQLLEEVASVRGLEIVPDRLIESGCEVDTVGGVIDARIDAYFDRLREEAA
jgi:Flagellar biosynthesis/type III secretory pathway protein